MLKIQDILTLQTLKIYNKFRNNKLPYYIQNWPLFQNSNIHNHNTRGANALHKNRCCHVFAQKSLKLNITNIVNGPPDIILDTIDTHSLNGFTNYVKLFLLQTYQDTCTVPNCICSLSNTLNTKINCEEQLYFICNHKYAGFALHNACCIKVYDCMTRN